MRPGPLPMARQSQPGQHIPNLTHPRRRPDLTLPLPQRDLKSLAASTQTPALADLERVRRIDSGSGGTVHMVRHRPTGQIFALSSSSFSSSGHRPRSGDTTPNATAWPRPAADLSPDAALALHRAGFHLTAAILQISPGSLLPPAQAATLFAIPDAAVADLSFPVADLSFPVAEHLFRYHTVPLRLSLSDLLKMPRGSCLAHISTAHLRPIATARIPRLVSFP